MLHFEKMLQQIYRLLFNTVPQLVISMMGISLLIYFIKVKTISLMSEKLNRPLGKLVICSS